MRAYEASFSVVNRWYGFLPRRIGVSNVKQITWLCFIFTAGWCD